MEEVVSSTRFFSRWSYQRVGSSNPWHHRSGSKRRTVRLIDPNRPTKQRWRVRIARKLKLRRFLGRIARSSGILLAPKSLLRMARESYVSKMKMLASLCSNAGLAFMGHYMVGRNQIVGGSKPLQNPVMSNKDLERLLRRAIAQGRFDTPEFGKASPQIS